MPTKRRITKKKSVRKRNYTRRAAPAKPAAIAIPRAVALGATTDGAGRLFLFTRGRSVWVTTGPRGGTCIHAGNHEGDFAKFGKHFAEEYNTWDEAVKLGCGDFITRSHIEISILS